MGRYLVSKLELQLLYLFRLTDEFFIHVREMLAHSAQLGLVIALSHLLVLLQTRPV